MAHDPSQRVRSDEKKKGVQTVCELMKSRQLRHRGAPICQHNFNSVNNISNILRYLYEKPPQNIRQCGWYGGQPVVFAVEDVE